MPRAFAFLHRDSRLEYPALHAMAISTERLRKRFDRGVALEPRHASWFGSRAERLMEEFRIARVAADPPRAEGDGRPGGWHAFVYFRLHGSPHVYYPSYGDEFLEALALELRALVRRVPTWCIFDNTTLGAGAGNAMTLMEKLTT